MKTTTLNIIRRTLFAAAIAVAASIAAYAQGGNLYESRSNHRFGYITPYQNTWVITGMNGGGQIKIYNCRGIGNNGIACVFTQFASDGRTSYSGEAQVYQSGAVYLRWLYDFTSGHQRNADSGWRGYQVR
jgi:hypothetical protein